MGAPVVNDINTLIAQYQQAFKPQQDVLDQQIDTNTQSGTAQVAGINAQKQGAFGQIEQQASNKGMAFSGFAPDAQAKYVGATYLPALANLQSSIEQTRMGLLGKKADLNTTANNQALDQNNREKTAFQQWQQRQEELARQEAEAERERQFKAAEAAKDRATTVATSRSGGSAAANPAKGFGLTRTADGGMQFHGPNGQPVTAAQYAAATGGNVRDILASSGTAGAQNVVKLIDSGMSYAELAKRYPYVFGGV